jgi:hypothetical protein
MFPGSGFREQGDNGLAKPFHLFNHRMELQEKSRDANIEKFDNAISNILRCPNQTGGGSAIRAYIPTRLGIGLPHDHTRIDTGDAVLTA